MKILARRGSCLDFAGDAVLFFHHSDIRPLEGALALLDWKCNAAVSRLLKRKKGLLEFGRMSILAPQGKIPAEKALITGLGPYGSLDRDLCAEAVRIALKGASDIGVTKLALDMGILENGIAEGFGEDLDGVLGKMDLPEPFTVALFRPGKEPYDNPAREAGSAGGTLES